MGQRHQRRRRRRGGRIRYLVWREGGEEGGGQRLCRLSTAGGSGAHQWGDAEKDASAVSRQDLIGTHVVHGASSSRVPLVQRGPTPRRAGRGGRHWVTSHHRQCPARVGHRSNRTDTPRTPSLLRTTEPPPHNATQARGGRVATVWPAGGSPPVTTPSSGAVEGVKEGRGGGRPERSRSGVGSVGGVGGTVGGTPACDGAGAGGIVCGGAHGSGPRLRRWRRRTRGAPPPSVATAAAPAPPPLVPLSPPRPHLPPSDTRGGHGHHRRRNADGHPMARGGAALRPAALPCLVAAATAATVTVTAAVPTGTWVEVRAGGSGGGSGRQTCRGGLKGRRCSWPRCLP